MDARLQRTRAPLLAGDPLRAVAALTVLVSHVTGLAYVSWALDRGTPGADNPFGLFGDVLAAGGPFGVSLFFVLSGYLLSRPFVRAFALGDRRPSLARFARNRILRVVPAYWVLLTILVLVVVLPGIEQASARPLARVYLFDGGFFRPLSLWIGHGWTLDVEMRFYLGLGLVGTGLALAGPRVRLSASARLAVLASIATAIAVWSFAAHPVEDPLTAIDFGGNVGRFSAGILLAVIEAARLPSFGADTRRAAKGLFAGGLAGLTAVCVAYAYDDGGLGLGSAATAGMTLTSGLVVAGPLLWQWGGGGRPWRVLDNRFMWWAGSRSYSIYLVHVPVFTALVTALGDESGYGLRAAVLAVAGAPLALGAAELLHRYVEVPSLGHRSPSQTVPGA